MGDYINDKEANYHVILKPNGKIIFNAYST